MVFSSLLFLFRFLPLVFLLYYLTPRRGRNVVLFLFSLFFYAWGEPKYVFFMLFSIIIFKSLFTASLFVKDFPEPK